VVGDEEDLGFDDHVQEFSYLHNCMREALRMHPPLIMLMRYARRDIEITNREGKNFIIPKVEEIRDGRREERWLISINSFSCILG